MANTYDSKCYELAEHFLADTPEINTDAVKVTLAQAIQQAVEDEIFFIQDTMEKM